MLILLIYSHRIDSVRYQKIKKAIYYLITETFFCNANYIYVSAKGTCITVNYMVGNENPTKMKNEHASYRAPHTCLKIDVRKAFGD